MNNISLYIITLVLLSSPALKADDNVQPNSAPNDAAFSQKAKERIDQREQKQEARIQKGIDNKSLTPEEQTKLQAEQAKIKDYESKASSDGVITKEEAHKISKMQNHASREIFRKKHDRKR